MAMNIPPHDFATGDSPMHASVIVTPELQRWAGQAVTMLNAVGAYVPVDLMQLRDGCAVSQFRWLWLVDEVLTPRPACPF